MSELDEKLNSILSNPQMMQQIMSLAQSLNQPDNSPDPPKQEKEVFQGIDPAFLSKVSSLMQHSGIDANQQALLAALTPYLSPPKLKKLEKAMHAARMAGIASDMARIRSKSSGR